MKLFVAVLGVVILAAGFGAPAQAQSYPWCAHYSGGTFSGQNCGFVSRHQCMATVKGIGGFCSRNTEFHGMGHGGGYYR